MDIEDKLTERAVRLAARLEEGCTCAQIMLDDDTRHFRGCPLREKYPTHEAETHVRREDADRFLKQYEELMLAIDDAGFTVASGKLERKTHNIEFPSMKKTPTEEKFCGGQFRTQACGDARSNGFALQCDKCGMWAFAGVREGDQHKRAPAIREGEPIRWTPKELVEAIDRAGFRLSKNLAHPFLGPTQEDRLTLWCKECGRDSGYHYPSCSVGKQMAEDWDYGVKAEAVYTRDVEGAKGRPTSEVWPPLSGKKQHGGRARGGDMSNEEQNQEPDWRLTYEQLKELREKVIAGKMKIDTDLAPVLIDMALESYSERSERFRLEEPLRAVEHTMPEPTVFTRDLEQHRKRMERMHERMHSAQVPNSAIHYDMSQAIWFLLAVAHAPGEPALEERVDQRVHAAYARIAKLEGETTRLFERYNRHATRIEQAEKLEPMLHDWNVFKRIERLEREIKDIPIRREKAQDICQECAHFREEHYDGRCWRPLHDRSPCPCEGFVERDAVRWPHGVPHAGPVDPNIIKKTAPKEDAHVPEELSDASLLKKAVDYMDGPGYDAKGSGYNDEPTTEAEILTDILKAVRDRAWMTKIRRGIPFQHDDGDVAEAFVQARIEAKSRPTIVCLCGSTRFSKAFADANLAETLKGNIVLTVGSMTHSDDELSHCAVCGKVGKRETLMGDWCPGRELKDGEGGVKGVEPHRIERSLTPAVKEMLDALHKKKIELADEVFVLNVVHCAKCHGYRGDAKVRGADGCEHDMKPYIGESTRGEIKHALLLGKPVRFLSDQLIDAALWEQIKPVGSVSGPIGNLRAGETWSMFQVKP